MDTTQPTVLNRYSSNEARKTALYQIYQQVLERQPYVYERKQLAHLEKEFLRGKLGVRRFLKEFANTSVYLDSFYYNSTNPKFIETCFKHFMGRAPRDRNELQFYCNTLVIRGIHEMINAMLDSEEYRKIFGCFTVPHNQHPDAYASPEAYLETEIVCHELAGRRGHVFPAVYWRQLGMNCDQGGCTYAHPDETLTAAFR